MSSGEGQPVAMQLLLELAFGVDDRFAVNQQPGFARDNASLFDTQRFKIRRWTRFVWRFR
jgi:hypothetical protein